jgi:competence protein ComEC
MVNEAPLAELVNIRGGVTMKHTSSALAAFVLLVSLVQTARAQEATLRVVDVGPGLCVIANAPPGKTMVYDAGYSGTLCGDAARTNSGGEVELLVLSHSDQDHISDAVQILQENETRFILHTGDSRSGTGLAAVRRAIRNHESATEYSLADGPPARTRFSIGDAEANFIAGWRRARDIPVFDGDPALRGAPARNAISIVIRFDYGEHSVLLTGDTIGRREPRAGRLDEDDALRYAERFMVDQDLPIDADVLIGQHHGSENSGSLRFLQRVSPEYIVYSAGHRHEHPRLSAIERAVAAGVDPDNIYRTDRSDDEGELEWDGERLDQCRDDPEDDDVVIRLPLNGAITVDYAGPDGEC